MNTVLSLIYILESNSLDNSITKTIATYFIDHIHEIENLNIQSIAKNTYTSTTSIIKFCQTLGFETYNSMKNKLVYTKQSRHRQIFEKLKKQTPEILIEKINIFSNETIEYKEFLKEIDSIVHLIHEKKKLYFYGASFPIALTQSFGEDMTMMGIPTHFVQIKNQSNHLEFYDGLHILVTYTGKFLEIHKSEYYHFLEFKNSNILFSQETMDIGDVYKNIQLPQSDHIDFDDITYLLLLDLIKLRYYTLYYKQAG